MWFVLIWLVLRSHCRRTCLRRMARGVVSRSGDYVHGDGMALTAQPLEIWRKLIAEEGLGPEREPLGPRGWFVRDIAAKLDRSW